MSADIVKLNIGGTIFTTSESTLTKFSGLFYSLFKPNDPGDNIFNDDGYERWWSFRNSLPKQDESGAYFLDRDPTHFRQILNYMRDGQLELPESAEDVKEIQKEAKYYQINGLVQICSIALEKYSKNSTGNILKLDVGGTIFKTSKSTLTRFDGFFKTMLETNVPITKDDSDAIFIDRSPKNFDAILQYMRDGRVELSGAHGKTREVQNEAKYYRLIGLVEMCEAALNRRVQRFHENFH